MYERFTVKGLEFYECIVEIFPNEKQYQAAEEDTHGEYCEWSFNLWIYQKDGPGQACEISENWRGNLKIDPGDADKVAIYENEKLLKSSKPVKLAIGFIEDYERPEKFKKYIHSQNYYFKVGEAETKAKPDPEPKVKIYDYQDVEKKQKLDYYRLNPAALDSLPDKERERLLRTEPYIREAYHLANSK